LELDGFVPDLCNYGTSALTLTVALNGEQHEFQVAAGAFQREITVESLPVGGQVLLKLEVSHTIQPGELDQRVLGMIWNRIALKSSPLREGLHMSPSRFRRESAPILYPMDWSGSLATYHQNPGARRILMVCAYLPCLGVHSGGNTMYNLIRILARYHRLTVLSFYEKESEWQYVPQLAAYCERLELVYRGQSFEKRDVFGLAPPEILHEFYHRRMQRLVDDHLRTGEFDILQGEYLQCAHFAGSRRSTPAVLTNHELLSLSYQNRFKKTSWASRAKLKTMASWMRMFNYEERMLRLFDGVVVLTRPEREFISQYVPGVKAYNHPTGVDCDFFTPGSDEIEPGTVLFVGNFRHFPNVGGMLWFLEYVWPKVCCTYPGARLHIVGGNPPKAISYAHGHNGVVVTGWVEDVRPYFRRSAVFVAPVFEG